VEGHEAWSAPGIAARFAGVSMIEGAIALPPMPRGASSLAASTVIAAPAALEVA